MAQIKAALEQIYFHALLVSVMITLSDESPTFLKICDEIMPTSVTISGGGSSLTGKCRFERYLSSLTTVSTDSLLWHVINDCHHLVICHLSTLSVTLPHNVKTKPAGGSSNLAPQVYKSITWSETNTSYRFITIFHFVCNESIWVSLFTFNYWNNWTFPRYSYLLARACLPAYGSRSQLTSGERWWCNVINSSWRPADTRTHADRQFRVKWTRSALQYIRSLTQQTKLSSHTNVIKRQSKDWNKQVALKTKTPHSSSDPINPHFCHSFNKERESTHSSEAKKGNAAHQQSVVLYT